jgi:hypothetical protein
MFPDVEEECVWHEHPGYQNSNQLEWICPQLDSKNRHEGENHEDVREASQQVGIYGGHPEESGPVLIGLGDSQLEHGAMRKGIRFGRP